MYQVTLHFHERKLSAKELKMTNENDSGCVLYDWEKETSYDNLTTEKICQSIRVADIKNYNSHSRAANSDEIIQSLPQGSIEITEEDMELIDEFLNV